MADRNRNRNLGNDSHREGGMSGASSGRGDEMSGMGGSSRSGGLSGSGSDRSSSNIGRNRSKPTTSGSREESMHGSSREQADDLDHSRRPDDEQGSMHGSSSGTTGLGGDRNQTSTGSPGGVEGVPDKSNPSPDEDRSRIQ